MTRINVIPVEELADQHLMAEYRELPRVFNQKVDTTNAPTCYKLGKGHVKWAKLHIKYLHDRYYKIVKEMRYRGFRTAFTDISHIDVNYGKNYIPTIYDILINRERISEKYKMKPSWYKWTKREIPLWLKN